MRLLGRLPRGRDRRGRHEGLHPREAEAGALVAVDADIAGVGGVGGVGGQAREGGVLLVPRALRDAWTAREKLATMPTDADIDFLFSVYSASPSREDGGPE